jgi:hypothetical protein
MKHIAAFLYLAVVTAGALLVYMRSVSWAGKDNRSSVKFLVPESQFAVAGILQNGWTVDLCADKCVIMDAEINQTHCPDAKHCQIELKLSPIQVLALRQYENRQKLIVVPNVVK